jgi:mannose/fructose/N-acetylgalactosamine-specific phosphotransferase system component IID/mannose/fructose/N-acetylgalactosamine-specific phosphotransferase system component IIC
MSVIQAALIALFYAFARSSFSAGLGGAVFAQPLVGGAIAGLLLGDPARGAALGAGLNLATLGLSALRVRVGPDIGLMGYVGVPVIMLAGIRAESPQTLAILAGLAALGFILNFLAGAFNTMLAHWADFFAERGDARLVAFINVFPSQIWLFLISFFPALILLLSADAQSIAAWAARIPDWASYAMRLFQQLLIILGIAMSLRAVASGSAIAYVGLGWIVAQVAADGGALQRAAPIFILGASLALIHAFIARRTPGALRSAASPEPAVTDIDEVPLLPGKAGSPPPVTLVSTFLLWQFFGGAATNFERGQNIGLAAALAPVVSALYPDKARRAAALRRNLTLFATEPTLGAGLVGALVAAEARSAGNPGAGGSETITDAELIGAKTAAMTVTGAAGDALIGGLATSVLVAIGAAMAAQGSLLGPLLFVLLQSALILGLAWVAFQAGHTWGLRGLEWADRNAWLRAGAFAAERLGAFVLGALLVRIAPLSFDTASISLDSARVLIQPWLDAFLPRLIPLALALWMWWRMRTDRSTAAALCGLCAAGTLIVTGLMKALGWL